ncbi:glycosyltransferase family 4 protein [Pelagicoccus albus]|uniref:Glycosyltransferase family 4 protein n=1 Tax=Pelagicoccus albus TaxID=415222 RepID=A0A7X1E9I0_9BACT|nr:glycosyltransferase family 1 protein [Pelagicoccus albus]MBC2607233.1 glycosyltransferase family 4 protein [Pelagicoccus albus]
MPKTTSKPIRVAYDIARLIAGGENGGIKVHHYEFLRTFVANHSDQLQLHIFCVEEIVPELEFLGEKGNHQIHILGKRDQFEPRNSDGSLPALHYWPHRPENLLELLEIDVLYAGFGFSHLYSPNIPQISLIVDVLHRAHPESLPPEEVAFRDKWYAEELEKATLVQTNSEFCKKQLIDEFGADPEKIFTIALPLHGRFNRVEMGPLPDQLKGLEHKYFLYPANYWPHKNHETLLEAFSRTHSGNSSAIPHLAFTGSEGPAQRKLENKASELGIREKVHFLDHLELERLKSAYELSKAIIFPSKYEGFGLPIIEAAHFQKPLACSRIDPVREISPANAIMFDPESAEDLTNVFEKTDWIRTRLPSNDDRLDLGTQARTIVRRFDEANSALSQHRKGVSIFGR